MQNIVRAQRCWGHSRTLHRALGAFLVLTAASAPAVTITEIHYNPPGAALGLEFIEVHNDSPTVVDLSGWSFREGIDFTFAKGTFLAGKGYLVVCANETTFQAAYPGVAVAGTYIGKLDSTGETLVLANNGGGEVLRFRYRDRGNWPSAPAGTGHTLSLRRPHHDPGEPESWTASAQLGGTPGAANFASATGPEVEVIPLGASWLYKKGTAEFSTPVDAWRQVGFSTAGWLSGPTGIGYADGDDATDLGADMPNGYMSVAARRSFTLTQNVLDATDRFVLYMNYDDGFVAYVNGVEVARSGLGAPNTPVAFDAAAANHEIGVEEEFEIPRSRFSPGSNVLAIQGHNAAIGSTDFSLAPRLARRLGGGASSPVELVFNEFLGRTAGPRWVELHNPGAVAVDLSGFHLTDDAGVLDKHTLPSPTTVPPGGFLVLSESEVGLDFSPPEVRLFLVAPDTSAVVLAQIFENTPTDGVAADRTGYCDARFPDGAGELYFTATPTPGAANQVAANRDVILNEILYNPPAGNSTPEFIELHNRGAAAVDLSGWSFTKGISYTFPAGTVIAPAGYLVVAQDGPRLEAAHGITGVLGPWTGNLSNAGENIRLADAIGNTVNEVRYHDGGRWSQWADGGGSSLEVIDPAQDNAFATAWAGSDESGKSQWTRINYTAAYTPEAQSELQFLLLDAGTVRLDEVSLKRSGSQTEYISNGGFETTTAPWLLQGNHIASRRIDTDAHAGSACLELVATGGGDNGVNKIDTDTTPAMTGGTYNVSFWARWIRGVDKLLSRADSSTGASLQRVHTLVLPQNLGTPGSENSARLALKAVSPSGNLGPVMGDVGQTPVTPGAGSVVTVRARASDADGVATVTVKYRTGGLGNGVFSSQPMFDDGAHQDGRAGDGLFSGELPGQPSNTRVTFYLEATDALGAVHRYPPEAPQKRLLYGVETGGASQLITSRIHIDDENNATLRGRLLHSDDLVDGTYVFNDEEIYYNVGLRYHGSPWNRPPDPKMFRVKFPGDRPFIRGLGAINLSRYGSSQDEGAAYYCVQSASLPHLPAPAGDYLYSRVFLNGTAHGLLAIVETVDGRYTEKWFPGDGDGYIYKIPGRRYLNDSGTMDGVDWTTLAYRGGVAGAPDEFERYRWYFMPGSNQEENRWADLNALCSMMDVGRTSTTVFDAQIENILDVEQFLAVEAARVLQDDWDTIGIGNGQNAFIYFAPNEGRFKLLPWDMDHTFGNVQAKLYPEGSEAQISRLVQRPKFRRMYLRIIQRMLASSWDPQYIGRYLSQTQQVMGASGQGILDFINARRPSVVAQAPPTATFKITHIGSTTLPADWPREHFTPRASERMRGTAPLAVESVIVTRNGEQLALNVSWATTTWSVDVPIGPGDNDFELFAFGVEGDLVSSFDFKVISTSDWGPPAVADVEPGFGPTSGGTTVEITGTGFRQGARVFFGAVQGSAVTVASATRILATTPAGAAGAVTVRVTNIDGQSGDRPAAFEFSSPLAFVRGDATGDGTVDLADSIRVLFFLYHGLILDCYDAADADNSGSIDLTDVITGLSYLFRGGQRPPSPFPAPGPDPTTPADALDCQRGL